MMQEYEIAVTLKSSRPIEDEVFTGMAEACIDELHRSCAFVALGPVATVDLLESQLEVDFSVGAESPEQVHEKVGIVVRTLTETLDSFEYRGSQTARLEPAVA